MKNGIDDNKYFKLNGDHPSPSLRLSEHQQDASSSFDELFPSKMMFDSLYDDDKTIQIQAKQKNKRTQPLKSKHQNPVLIKRQKRLKSKQCRIDSLPNTKNNQCDTENIEPIYLNQSLSSFHDNGNIWYTKTTNSHTLTYSSQIDQMEKTSWDKKYCVIRQLGKPGSYGLALEVEEVTDGDRKKFGSKSMVMKIMLKNTDFINEIKIMKMVKEGIFNKKQCPNFCYFHSWFVTESLPDTGKWGNIICNLKKIFFSKGVCTPGTITQFGVILMEKADSGCIGDNLRFSLRKFIPNPGKTKWSKSDLNKRDQCRKTVKVIIAQLLHSLVALKSAGIFHCDITSYNVLLCKAFTRNTNLSVPIKYPLCQSLGNAFNLDINLMSDDYITDDVVPMMIDYSISTTEKDKNDFEEPDYPPTALCYRAPEYKLLRKGSDVAPSRTYEADLFSMGIVILSIILGNEPTSKTCSFQATNSVIRNNANIYREALKDKDSIFSKFICSESWKNTCEHMIGLAAWIGLPSAKDLNYKTSEIPLFKVLYETIPCSHVPFLLDPKRNDDANLVHAVLGPDGIDLIKSILKWNPSDRQSAESLLMNHPYFSEFRSTTSCKSKNKNIWNVELPENPEVQLTDGGENVQDDFDSQDNDVLHSSFSEEEEILMAEQICAKCENKDACLVCEHCQKVKFCSRSCFQSIIEEHKKECVQVF